ncbi:hypothetical protein [Flavobacterium sp.]|uniref:hypothetical protein n=1 Tax=Flavobacterium sp. TaxID=239 RepID=UPI0040332A77
MRPLEKYVDNDTHYIIFNRETQEKNIYQYAYRQALKLGMKVGELIYRDSIYQITLKPF